MGFQEAIATCLKLKYATLQGRAARSEYWYFILFQAIVYGILAALTLAISLLNGSDPVDAILYGEIEALLWVPLGLILIFFLAMFIPSIAVTVRRLHDRNMSGWWYLAFFVAGFVPVLDWVSSIALLVIMALKGTDGDNRYGPDPLRGVHDADIFA